MQPKHTRILTVMIFALLCASSAAQTADRIAELERLLVEQQSVNRALMERVEAIERAHTAIEDRLHLADSDSAAADDAGFLIEQLYEEIGAVQERLDRQPTLSGYYDFEYLNDDRTDSPGEFRQHHLSLHVTKEWADYRMFAEAEFEFGAKFEGDGGLALEEARGEIKLEQAWGEYIMSDALVLRGGLMLTPGYWNVNHYPTVVLSTRRPLMVRRVFREAITGIMGYGTWYWGDFGLTYNAYVGNGESDIFTKHDDNEGKAVGGRVTFHVPSGGRLDKFDLGLSGYHESPTGTERTQTWGFDARIRKDRFELLTEFARRESDGDRTGLYFQPSYRFSDKWAMFYRYDLLDDDETGEQQEHTLGVNYRPIPEVSFKLEYFHANRSTDEDSSGVAASVAVSF